MTEHIFAGLIIWSTKLAALNYIYWVISSWIRAGEQNNQHPLWWALLLKLCRFLWIHICGRVNQQAQRSMFMQECRLAILVHRGVKSEPHWATTILLITHENGESGCCEAWLFCGPCYFNRDLQWNVFIRAEAAAQGRLLSRWTMAALITEGLRGQRPKPMRADSLQPLRSNFCFSLLQTVGWVRNKRLHKARASASVFERDDPSNKDLKENNPRNMIVFFIPHLGEAFLSLPPSCEGRGYDPWNGFENNPLRKKRKTLESLTKKVQIC